MNKSLNILFLTTHLNAGGITSYIYFLCRDLVEKGHKIFVLSSGGERENIFRQAGIEVINLDIRTKSELSLKLWFNASKISLIIKENNIDIIHAHTRVTQVLGSVLSRCNKVPMVTTCHGFFKPRFSRVKFGCWGEKAIAISSAVKRHLIEDLKVDPGKIVLIHNGVDLRHYTFNPKEKRPARRKELNLPEKPTIGIIARLSDVKGHEFLIKAFKNLLNEGLDMQLLIVGDGKFEQEISSLVKRLDIENQVIFLPGIEDTKLILDALDIFCMPSLKEGLGLAVAEAQASGVAVIVSKVGGLVDLVQNGINGILTAPEDYQAIASSIKRLLNDQELYDRLTLNARKSVEEQFFLKQMVASIEKLYMEISHGKN